jgi:hypothetical protein
MGLIPNFLIAPSPGLCSCSAQPGFSRGSPPAALWPAHELSNWQAIGRDDLVQLIHQLIDDHCRDPKIASSLLS